MWNHFDSGSCPGQAIGVRSRLDNGVQGFIPTKFLSDKVVKHPEERVKVRHFLLCPLYLVDLTCNCFPVCPLTLPSPDRAVLLLLSIFHPSALVGVLTDFPSFYFRWA